MTNTVVIDCFPESVSRYQEGFAVAVIDVVRATTTAITAAASGRQCFLAATLGMALELARTHQNALLAGEQAGIQPPGFDLNNSPAELMARTDIDRPVILLSSSGTRLCYEASKCGAVFLACLRNYASAARFLAHFPNVAVIGAGSKNEFREEDQMCCAWIAERLLDRGYVPGGRDTLEAVRRWSGKPVDAWLGNKSAAYLRRSGQLDDLCFILDHVDDLSASFTLRHGEVCVSEDGAESGTAVTALERSL
ncbi:MAG: 2-phosphosulfolactate phosphatase [Candidatus Binataceae bacterium]